MDLERIKYEVNRVAETVATWHDAAQIPAIERDLLLDSLRRLYEEVRFAEQPAQSAGKEANVAPVVADESDAVTLPIDLGEVLSLDELPAEEPLPEADSEGAILAQEPEEEPAKVQLEPAETEPIAEQTPLAEPVVAEPIPAPMPEEPAVEPAVESQPEPQPQTAQPAAAQQVAPTLFGLDDEALVHRHKQRVIMSLYDSVPDPAPVSKSKEDEDDVFEVVTVETTAAEPQTAEYQAAEAISASQESEPLEEDESFDQPSTDPVVVRDSDDPEPTAVEQPNEEPEVVATIEDDFEEVTPKADMPIQQPEPIQPEVEQQPEPIQSEPVEQPAPTVLGEVMNQGVQTLGEVLAARQQAEHGNVEPHLGEPIGDLRRAIGINDKFLLIRDLFDGDAAAYEAAMECFNGFDNLDDCMIYIAENYAWNANSDGAKLITELLERKFAE